MKGPELIKTRLRDWIVSTRGLRSGDVLVEEMCFLDKRNRADLVHANGVLSAFEIKSGHDTLARWPSQMEAYLGVFDEVWLCMHGKHVGRAMEATTPSVGLLVADDYGGLAIIRPAARNKKVFPYHLTGLLWRAELDALCRNQNIPVNRKEGIKAARERVSREVSLTAIREHVLCCLKLRYADRAPQMSSSSSEEGLVPGTETG